LICEYCGKHFASKRRSGPVPSCCSELCRYLNEKRKEREHPRYVNVCKFCGDSFFSNFKAQLRCSHRCKGAQDTLDAIEKATRILSDGFKICSRCGVEKLLEEFSKSSANYDGHGSCCKRCNSDKWAKRKSEGKIKRSPESIRKHREKERVRRRTNPE